MNDATRVDPDWEVEDGIEVYEYAGLTIEIEGPGFGPFRHITVSDPWGEISFFETLWIGRGEPTEPYVAGICRRIDRIVWRMDAYNNRASDYR